MKGFIPKNTHPVNYILLLLLYMLGGFFVGNFISLVVMHFGYSISLTELAAVVQNPAAYPNGKQAVNIFQGISHFCAFTLAPLALILSVGLSFSEYFTPVRRVPLGLLLLSALLILAIMPANSWVIDVNTKMDLPDFLSGFENWAKAKEESLKDLTQYLTKFDSVGELIFGLIIFALIPAIGEELVFRGIVQKQCMRWLKNPHVAIWITAIIFGAIHLQFYGMLPRTLLGALLGYLYWWSGNIWVPILGHFMNNGFTVFMLYMVQQKNLDFDVESTAAMPLASILFSLLATIAILSFLRRQFYVLHPTDNRPTAFENS